jgi:O-antigen ligase
MGYEIFYKKTGMVFPIRKSIIPILFILFYIICLVSLFQALVFSEALYVISKIGVEILFFLITYFLLVNNKLNINTITKAILILLAVSILVAIYQFSMIVISGDNLISNLYKIKSGYANKNLFSFIVYLSLPFVIIAIKQASQIMRWLVTILLLVSIFVLLLIQTRSALIALVVFIVVFSFLCLSFSKSKLKVLRYILSMFLVCAIFLSPFIVKTEYLSRIRSTHTVYTRIKLWDNSIQMVEDHIVVGIGVGNWKFYFPKYGLDKFSSHDVKNGMKVYQRPHNDFLWVLCETGVFGLVLFVSILGVAMLFCFKLIRYAKSASSILMYSVFLSVLAGYLVIYFTDFSLERIEHQVILCFIIAIVSAQHYKEFLHVDRKKRSSKSYPFILLTILIPLFSFIVGIKRYQGELHTRRMYTYHHNANWKMMIYEADKAYNQLFYSVDPTSVPLSWYKGIAFYAMDDLPKAHVSLTNAYKISPYNLHVLNNLAGCYAAKNNNTRAQELYIEALRISSEFDEALLNLSAVYYNNGMFIKAFETIDKCEITSSDPDYKIFLQAILKSYLNENQSIDIYHLSDKEIIEKYFYAKRNNIKFTEYLNM